MPEPATRHRRRLPATALFLLGAAVFAAAYGQAPLYYSNQNQYFLHGLARAGVGLLGEDWLANTRDPTPAFSALVALTARYLHPRLFYLYYALLQGAYAAAMLGLFFALAGRETAARRWPAFVALFVLAHSALARWASCRWRGVDYPWYLQAGVAGQYVLGPVLQPSAFGALLVVAVWLFVRGRPFLAVVCVALAVTMHSTYLLPAGLLTLGFLAALWAEGRPRQALRVGAWALALVLPTAAYVAVAFRPTSAGEFARAQDVLVNVRIPHHCRPGLWLDRVAGLQIVWVVLGLALARRGRLFLVLAVPFAASALLTLLQAATGSHTFALLFPWRVSAVLVPVATTVVLSRLVAVSSLALGGAAARAASAVAVAVLAAGGVWIMAGGRAFTSPNEEVPVMDFVRRTKQPGDVYFLSVTVPDLAKSARGSRKSDLQPLPEKRRDPQMLPVDLERFRLSTGAPVFVDFKSIPYRDTDVLEWYDRLRLVGRVREDLAEGRQEQALAGLRASGATHAVLPRREELRAPGVDEVYRDDYYRVYRLGPAPGPPGSVRRAGGRTRR